jgi:hypothetical protein
MKSIPIKKELLFIHHTITNGKLNNNKCAHAIIDNTTNIIYPQDLLDPNILIAIGLAHDDLKACADFFNKEDKQNEIY